MSEGFVYVLQLKNDNFYVGWSEVPEDRIVAHFSGEGSEWSKKHHPEKVLDVRPGGKMLEKLVTLEYMTKYHWTNVRGGPWTAVDLKSPPVAMRKNSTSTQSMKIIFPKADNQEPVADHQYSVI